KIEWLDPDITNSMDVPDGSVKIDNENIEDATIVFLASENGGVVTINGFVYALRADASIGSNTYVPPGHSVREFLDEPEGLLEPSLDIIYEGLFPRNSNELSFYPESDTQYMIEFTNGRGMTYTVPFLYFDEAGVYFGDDNNQNGDALVFEEEKSVVIDDYFILESNNITSVLEFEDIDPSEKTFIFSELSTGSTIEGPYNDSGHGFIVKNGVTHAVRLVASGTLALRILVDLNGDGDITDDKVDIWFGEYKRLILPNLEVAQSLETPFAIFLRIEPEAFEDSIWPEVFSIRFSNTTTRLSVDLVGYSGPHEDTEPWNVFDMISDDANDDYDRGLS
ncbi:hypothetical protein GOV10_05695, partial [Candidatus Woesearchaeota archaeon]|nr:hypothetical protein [Candidatus Woesearchaeota archaeon]